MPPISTRNLSLLPDVDRLRELWQSMAMLDAILCPDWEGRYYSFNSSWSKGEMMGSMRDGAGDNLFALFNSQGCFLKGFAHESPFARPSIAPTDHYRNIPAEFASCVTEPAFATDDVTFCLWRKHGDLKWSRNRIPLPVGNDPDGSIALLSPLDGNPETYREWAESYYECDVSVTCIKAIYGRQRLTKELVKALNPELRLKDLKDDIREIGYPG